MKITCENKLLYSVQFTQDEIWKIAGIANKSGKSIEDCLTAFFSGCLYHFNNGLAERTVSNELEG